MTTELHPLISLHGKKGLVLGLANEHSIAWGCARTLHACGAQIVTTCLNDKARAHVEPLVVPLGIPLLNCNLDTPDDLACAVNNAAQRLGGIDFVIHSIAWAPLSDLHGPVLDSSRDGFARAMSVSCHSFAELARLCLAHMPQGGSLLTMSYLGAEVAVPHYGLMGPVKAALESMVRYLALELKDGKPLDPVARFHLGNGARVERLNWAADPSAKGFKQSYGLMVNYLYDPKKLDKNRAALAQSKIPVAPAIKDLLP